MAKRDSSRRIPSDARPRTIGRRARVRRLAKRTFPDGLPPKDKCNGPRYHELLAYLKQFVGTPYERKLWNVYFRNSRPRAGEFPLLEVEAREQKLDVWEYIYRETLAEVRRFVQAKGIPAEVTAAAETEAAYLGDCRVRIGKDIFALSEREDSVLAVLVDKGAVSKATLENDSGYQEGEGIKILRGIAKHFPALEKHIFFPGRKGYGGYRTTIQAAK